MTVVEALREAARRLQGTSDSARLDAELLMAHALGVSRSRMLINHQHDSEPPEFAALIARRQGHEPLAYIVGEQEFYGLTFKVTPAVLIPRADSETLIEAALQARPNARSVLDCGTGSGALLLAVLAHLSQARGTGIERSAAALEVARDNAERLGLAHRTELLLADWADPAWQTDISGPFDLILANPPYVEESAILSPSVRQFEPAGALFAGPDGLDAYRQLIPQLPPLLASDGLALIEIGATQAKAVGTIAEEAGFTVRLRHDLAGRPRVLELSHTLSRAQ